jgi:5-methyltetrahydropteroyltriglutamate--homocysteine methyltransferase
MAIRTTVVGSFPKVTETGSDNLPGTIDKWQKQVVNDQGLQQEIEKVIRRVLKEQEEAGLDLVTDGQVRWEDLPHLIARSSTGIQRGALRRFFDNNVYYRRLEMPALSEAEGAGGVSWQKSAAADEVRFASTATKKPVKAALPGPLMLATATELKAGQTVESLIPFYAELLRQEVQALEKAGVKEIQIDEPNLSAAEPLTAKTVEVINQIFAGVKARRWVAVYFQDVSAFLPALAKLQVEVLGLDLVSAREKNPGLLVKVVEFLKSGAWKGEVALGLVDARNTKLEDLPKLKQEIAQFTQAVSEDKLWLSPNCGLEFLPHEAAVKKLKVLREAAQAV